MKLSNLTFSKYLFQKYLVVSQEGEDNQTSIFGCPHSLLGRGGHTNADTPVRCQCVGGMCGAGSYLTIVCWKMVNSD